MFLAAIIYNSVFCKLLPQNFLRKCTNIHQTGDFFPFLFLYISVHLTSFYNTLNLKRITPQKTSLFKIFTFCVPAGHWTDTDSKRAANSCSRLLLDHPPTTARWTCTSCGAQVLDSLLPQQSNARGCSRCGINFRQWIATVIGLLPLTLFCNQPPNKNSVAGNNLPELSLISLSCRRMRTIIPTSSSQS